MKTRAGIAALTAALITTTSLSAQESKRERPDRPDRPHRPQARIFDRIDEDKSGTIDLDELKAAMERRAEERFKRMDKDADGEVTKEEFRRPRRHDCEGKGDAEEDTDLEQE